MRSLREANPKGKLRERRRPFFIKAQEEFEKENLQRIRAKERLLDSECQNLRPQATR